MVVIITSSQKAEWRAKANYKFDADTYKGVTLASAAVLALLAECDRLEAERDEHLKVEERLHELGEQFLRRAEAAEAARDLADAWAKDEQQKRHKAEDERLEARERLAAAEAERNEVQAQLRMVDSTLARRPALNDVLDRLVKIERACKMAGRAEAAEAALSRERAVREAAEHRADEIERHGLSNCCIEDIRLGGEPCGPFLSLQAEKEAAEAELAEAKTDLSHYVVGIEELRQELLAAEAEREQWVAQSQIQCEARARMEAALEQAHNRLVAVQRYKDGTAPTLPAVEAALECTRAALADTAGGTGECSIGCVGWTNEGVPILGYPFKKPAPPDAPATEDASDGDFNNSRFDDDAY